MYTTNAARINSRAAAYYFNRAGQLKTSVMARGLRKDRSVRQENGSRHGLARNPARQSWRIKFSAYRLRLWRRPGFLSTSICRRDSYRTTLDRRRAMRVRARLCRKSAIFTKRGEALRVYLRFAGLVRNVRYPTTIGRKTRLEFVR